MVPPSSFPPQVCRLSVPAALFAKVSREKYFARWNSLSSVISGVIRSVGVQAPVGKQLEDTPLSCAHEWQLVSFHNSTFQLFCKLTL
jgi:hypothetical protein